MPCASTSTSQDLCRVRRESSEGSAYTIKTGIPIEEGDSTCILKLLRRVSRPEIQLAGRVNCTGIYFSSQEQIAYFLTQEAVYSLFHFKFLRVQLTILKGQHSPA